MKFLIILVISFFTLTSGIYSVDKSVDFKSAEVSYQQGDYEAAYQIYNNAFVQYPKNIDLLYNLGNIYLKKGDIGKSICFYMRVLKYKPFDRDVRYNLAIANSMVVDNVENQSVFRVINTFFTWISFNFVFVLFLVLFFVFNGVFMLLFIQKKKLPYLRSLFASFLSVFIGLGVVVGIKYYQDIYITKGVIIEKKVAVRTGPSKALDTSFFVHEGTTVKIVRNRQNWIEVELVNGFKGWINSNQLWKI